MSDCRIYHIDTQPLPEGADCEFYEARTDIEDNPVIRVQLTNDCFIAEWFVEGGVEEFRETIDAHIPDDTTRAGAVVAKQTEDGKVLEAPLNEFCNAEWYPDYCTFLEIEPETPKQIVAWDHSYPRSSIIHTAYTNQTNLLQSLLASTLPNPAAVEAIVDELNELFDETLTHENAR